MTTDAYDATNWTAMPTDDNAERARLAVPGEGLGARVAERLWEGTSGFPLRRTWGEVPDEFGAFLDVVYDGGEGHRIEPLEYEATGPTASWRELTDDGSAWVLFTGGKDSVAAAIRAEAAGYRPRLLHLRGLNRGVMDEVIYAEATAAHRGWEFHVVEVRITGKKVGFLECPTKNVVAQLVLSDLMADRGGAVWTAGYHAFDDNSVQGYLYDYGDGVQTLAAFRRYLHAANTGMRYIGDLQDTAECWAVVAGAGLLGYVKGCYAPLRFKRQWRERNEAKFGPLLAGRCGSCIKCAWEQVALEELGVVAPNPALRASQAKFITRDFLTRGGGTLQGAIDFLVPPETVERYRRPFGEWPEQDVPPWAPLPALYAWKPAGA